MNFKSKPVFSNQNQLFSPSKKVELEQQVNSSPLQKYHQNQQKLTQLYARRSILTQTNQEYNDKLRTLKEKIKNQQECSNPVVKQLREHFKALREELRGMSLEEQGEDDVDIDNMTYEQLLELGDTIGKVSKGLSSTKLQSLQKFAYSNHFNLQQDCSICREQFDQGLDCIRLACKHFFHSECLKGWLHHQKTCPNCKTEIV